MNSPIELKNFNGNNDKYNFGGYQVNTYFTYNLSIPEEDKLYFGPTIGLLMNLGKIRSKDDTYDTTPTYFPSGISNDELLKFGNMSIKDCFNKQDEEFHKIIGLLFLEKS
mgnify:CR=1 FL=1